MRAVLAFDVYGTLIDPLGITAVLRELVGDEAPALASAWREKQLEYLFRRGLGHRYEAFSVCTQQALEFVCASRGVALADEDRDSLLAAYVDLPAFPEAGRALAGLRDAGFRCFAFSNGEPAALTALLSNAGIGQLLDGIVSVHEVRSFKPDPAVYANFLDRADTTVDRAWLVSGNAFDIIGALACGWRAAWVRRNPTQVFDPWDMEPTVTVADLDGLSAAID
jgi:2-haloacid dehalogenase